MPLWIDNDRQLADYLRQLPMGAPVALDTEFDWTHTFFPVFALLQIGVSRSDVAIVDALAIRDWSPLAEVLNDRTRQKLVFSGANDLPILVRACGGSDAALPVNIFDIQSAEGFLGRGAALALKKVVEIELGIPLDKSETRSDWTLRPLTPQQLEYAAGDVALLPDIAAKLTRELAELGNLERFQNEMLHFSQKEYYALPPVTHAWHRLSGYSRLPDAAARARARSLACWREETCRAKDLGRSRLLSDIQLYWVAEHHPRTADALRRMPRAKNSVIRNFGDDIVKAQELPAPEDHRDYARISLTQKALLHEKSERIAGLVQKRAEAAHIEPSLIASKREIEAAVACYIKRQPCHAKFMSGWRAELLQPTLDEILPQPRNP